MDLSGVPLGPVGDSFRHKMGLRRLESGSWLELKHPEANRQRAYKDQLMDRQASDLFVALPGIEAAAEELRHEIIAEHRLQGLAAPGVDDRRHPLDDAARMVREDLCLHTSIDGRLVLSGGSVCFPTRWTLAEKIGRPLDLIHQPVPGYEADLAARVNTFVDRLGTGPGVWRRNWSLMSTGELCLPGHHEDVPLISRPEDAWLRTERQTLRRLPLTGAVVFTIAIDVEPLPSVAATRDTAVALAATIEGLPSDFRAYKGLAGIADEIIDYLRSV